MQHQRSVPVASSGSRRTLPIAPHFALIALLSLLGPSSCGGGGSSPLADDPLAVLSVELPSGPALRLGQTLTLRVSEPCAPPADTQCPVDAVWSVTGPDSANAGEFLEVQGSTVHFVTFRAGNYSLRATATDGSGRYGTQPIPISDLDFDTQVRVDLPGSSGHDAILGADLVSSGTSRFLAHSVRGTLSALASYERSGQLILTEDTDTTCYPATEQEAVLELGIAPSGDCYVMTDGPGTDRTVTKFGPDFIRNPAFVAPAGYAYLPAIAVDRSGTAWVGYGTAAVGIVKLSATGSVVGEFALPSPLSASLCSLALVQGDMGPTALYAADRTNILRVTPTGTVDASFSPPPLGGDILDVAVDGLGRVYVAVQEIDDGLPNARGAILVLNERGRLVKTLRSYDHVDVPGSPATARDLRHPLAVAADPNGVLWVYDDLIASGGAPNARLVEWNADVTLPAPSIVLTPTWYFMKPGWRRRFTATAQNFGAEFEWSAFNGDSTAGDGYVDPLADSSNCDFFAPATPGTYSVRVTSTLNGALVSAEASVTVTASDYGFGADAVTPGVDNHDVAADLAVGGPFLYYAFRNYSNPDFSSIGRLPLNGLSTAQSLPTGNGTYDADVYPQITADRGGNAYWYWLENIPGEPNPVPVIRRWLAADTSLPTDYFRLDDLGILSLNYPVLAAGAVDTLYVLGYRQGIPNRRLMKVSFFQLPPSVEDLPTQDPLAQAEAVELLVDSTGRLLYSDLFFHSGVHETLVRRLLCDGSPDPTFETMQAQCFSRIASDDNGLVYFASYLGFLCYPPLIRVFPEHGYVPSIEGYSLQRSDGLTELRPWSSIESIAAAPDGAVYCFESSSDVVVDTQFGPQSQYSGIIVRLQVH